MFRIGFLLILVGSIVLAFTNPGKEAHEKVVCDKMPNHAGIDGLMGRIAGGVLGKLDVLPLEYHNYILFSTATLKDKTVSIGFLQTVRATDWESEG